MKNYKNNLWLQLFVIFTRYGLGTAFVFASIIKIKGNRFTSDSQEDAAFGTLGNFFEAMYQAGFYWQFLGWAQLIAGFLLMTQHYSKLGAAVNLGIILNIFVITISLDFNFTPVITGSMLLANLFLIFWHWGELRIFFNLPYIPDTHQREENRMIWKTLGCLLFLYTVGYKAFNDYYNVIFWMAGYSIIGLTALLFRYFGKPKSKSLLN